MPPRVPVSRPLQMLTLLVFIALFYFFAVGSHLRSYQNAVGRLRNSPKTLSKFSADHSAIRNNESAKSGGNHDGDSHHHSQNEHVLREEIQEHHDEDDGEHHPQPTVNASDEEHFRHHHHDSEDSSRFPPLIRPDPKRYSSSATQNAYLVVISNEDFVDGALTLGVSLRLHSPMLQSGEAHLVTIVTAGRLRDRSIARLQQKGTYDKVIEVPSLAVRAPGAFWKDTFDKIYMFNLTEYHRAVFMDADMLCVRSPDALFDLKGISPEWLAAIGNRAAHDTYFQTGMMVIEPSQSQFQRIVDEFESGIPPKGKQYNRGLHGRDGVLLRNVFKANFRPLDNKYSRNLNPRFPIPKSVVSLHFRGKHKPWFNRLSPVEDPELGKKEFGFAYRLWWEIYEHYVHGKVNPLDDEFGGNAAGVGITAETHVWMMRYSKKEYVQLLNSEGKRRRDVPFDGVDAGGVFVKSKKNQSCTEACKKLVVDSDENSKRKKRKCVEAAFNYTSAEDCETLERVLGPCKVCQMGVYWRHHKGNDYPSIDTKTKVCTFNLLHDQRSMPNCDARHEMSRRLCPCK